MGDVEPTQYLLWMIYPLDYVESQGSHPDYTFDESEQDIHPEEQTPPRGIPDDTPPTTTKKTEPLKTGYTPWHALHTLTDTVANLLLVKEWHGGS